MLKNAFEEHKLMRRIVVFMVALMAGFATWAVYGNLALANSAIASIYAVTMGLMTTIVGFYMKLRTEETASKMQERDNERRNRNQSNA